MKQDKIHQKSFRFNHIHCETSYNRLICNHLKPEKKFTITHLTPDRLMPEHETRIELVRALNKNDSRTQSVINDAVAELIKHSTKVELNELDIENARLVTIEGHKSMGIETALGCYFMDIVASVVGAWVYDTLKKWEGSVTVEQPIAPSESQLKKWVKEAVTETLRELPEDVTISESAILKGTSDLVVEKRLVWHEIFLSSAKKV